LRNCFRRTSDREISGTHKIEEEVGGVPGYPERIRGRFGAEPWEIRGRTVVGLGQVWDRFGAEFSGFLGSIFTPFLAFLRPPWSPVEWTFRRFGPIVIGLARPLFRPLLVPLLDRVFRHFGTRTCSLPYKKSSDVTLPIANKSAHPVRVRFFGK
jgi:hypothetical protein